MFTYLLFHFVCTVFVLNDWIVKLLTNTEKIMLAIIAPLFIGPRAVAVFKSLFIEKDRVAHEVKAPKMTRDWYELYHYFMDENANKKVK